MSCQECSLVQEIATSQITFEEPKCPLHSNGPPEDVTPLSIDEAAESQPSLNDLAEPDLIWSKNPHSRITWKPIQSSWTPPSCQPAQSQLKLGNHSHPQRIDTEDPFHPSLPSLFIPPRSKAIRIETKLLNCRKENAQGVDRTLVAHWLSASKPPFHVCHLPFAICPAHPPCSSSCTSTNLAR